MKHLVIIGIASYIVGMIVSPADPATTIMDAMLVACVAYASYYFGFSAGINLIKPNSSQTEIQKNEKKA